MKIEEKMLELLQKIEVHLDPRRERRYDYNPLTPEEARSIASDKETRDIEKLLAKVYEYVRGAAKNEQMETTIDLPQNELTDKAMQVIKDQGYTVNKSKGNAREYIVGWKS